MIYRYEAYTVDKKIVRGKIDADSESMAEGALYQAGYHRILSLRETRPRPGLESLMPFFFGVKVQDVIDFSRQLASLIESGVNILSAVRLLEEQASKPALKKVITGLVQELRGGSLLSQAFSKYPDVFSYTYCQVMKASEQAGNAEVGLRQVAGYMEQQAQMIKRVRRAMAYPSMVLLMGIGVCALLITVLLPSLSGLFTSFDAELPWMTRLLMAASSFLINYKWYLLGGAFTLIILIVGYARLPVGRLTMHMLLLKMPLIGSINIERNMGHFSRTTSVLLKVGLQLPQIINIVIGTIGNEIIRRALRDVREKVVQGQSLSQSMTAIGPFPRLLVEMVGVGEKTGNLDSSLATVADFYEQRVNQRIDTLTSMIEPIMTVGMGLVVAFIALSVITPLYSILGAIQ